MLPVSTHTTFDRGEGNAESFDDLALARRPVNDELGREQAKTSQIVMRMGEDRQVAVK